MLSWGARSSRVGVALGAAALSLVVAEYSVRIAVPAYDPTGHIAFFDNPRAGVALGKPDSTARQVKNSGDYDVKVAFNLHGLRDRQDIAAGTARDIYVIGDSFAFGWGVEEDERFSNALAKLTAHRVYNVGTIANLDGYEKLLVYVSELGADIKHVVLAINMIDDVQNYDAPPLARPVVAPPANASVSVQLVKEFLLKNSALYFLATSAIGSIDLLRQFFVRVGLVKTLNVVSGGVPDMNAIQSTAARIALLARKYDLTTLIIPSRGLWVGENRKASAAAHDRFIGELRRLGLDYVDMRPVMEQTGNPMQFHFRNDGHWVPQGHFLAARQLAPRIALSQKHTGSE